MRRSAVFALFLSALGFVGAQVSTALAADTTLNVLIMSDTAYSDKDVSSMTASFNETHPGIVAKVDFVPYAGLRDRILLSQGSEGAYDVILMDVIWIAEFAKRNMIVDVTDRVDSSLRSQVFDGAWQTADFGGKLYGFPWLVDAKFISQHQDASLTRLRRAAEDHRRAGRAGEGHQGQGHRRYGSSANWGQNEEIVCDFAFLPSEGGNSSATTASRPSRATSASRCELMHDQITSGLGNPELARIQRRKTAAACS
jgi:multiple sugar transport system substrate-binding protein